GGAARPLGDLRPADRADAGDAQVHPLDRVPRVVPVRVAVQPLVGLVEPVDHLCPPGLVDRAGRGRYPHLVRLAVVAQVDAAGVDVPVAGEALAVERVGGLGLQLGDDARGGLQVEVAVAG